MICSDHDCRLQLWKNLIHETAVLIIGLNVKKGHDRWKQKETVMIFLQGKYSHSEEKPKSK